jgi:hypothetical protein
MWIRGHHSGLQVLINDSEHELYLRSAGVAVRPGLIAMWEGRCGNPAEISRSPLLLIISAMSCRGMTVEQHCRCVGSQQIAGSAVQ